MNRRPVFTAIALAVTGLVAACGPSSPPPASATATAASAAPSSCDARFTLQNRSAVSVAEFYFRPAGSSEWGADRLVTRLLSRGLTVGYRAGGDGRYDLRIVWANGRESRLDNVNLCETPLIVADDGRLFAPGAAGVGATPATRTGAAAPANSRRRNPPN